MTESKKIVHPELGEMKFHRYEESQNSNMITYVLELPDGRFAKCSRLRRYKNRQRILITPEDLKNKSLELDEMNRAVVQMAEVLKAQGPNIPSAVPQKTNKILLTKIGHIHENARS